MASAVCASAVSPRSTAMSPRTRWTSSVTSERIEPTASWVRSPDAHEPPRYLMAAVLNHSFGLHMFGAALTQAAELAQAASQVGRTGSPEQVQQAVNYVLSQDVTGLCTVGDTRLLPLVLKACENFTPLSLETQEALVADAVEKKLFYLPGPK